MLIARPYSLFILFSACALSVSGVRAEMYFPADLVSADGESVADLSHFSADGTQVAGSYLVDIYLNDTFVSTRKVRFESSVGPADHTQDDTGLVACLYAGELEKAGLKTELNPSFPSAGSTECIVPGLYIPGVMTSFDFSDMRLNISVPQAAVRHQARGYISPELWEDGITAARLNYNFTGSNTRGGNNHRKNYFLGLDSGLNVGPWRLRDSRTLNVYKTRYDTQHTWQRLKTYLERGISRLHSNLVLGESTTDSAIFDSLAFRGVQLGTDDNMYPDTMRGFAPVIRGTANSNADISIRQNGYTIYTTSVPPGPFEITDLSPMYSSGDIEVSVREASGNTRVFTVPYSVVPSMLREGRVKYSVAAGYLRASSSHYDTPAFAQGSLLWGGPLRTTIYGGVQLSGKYRAGKLGAGVDMGHLGALSVDATHADSTLVDDSQAQGQSYRFLYSQALIPTGTSFRLTGYQYSTRGFHTLEETALKSMSGRLNDHNGLDSNGLPEIDQYSDYYNLHNNKRARFEVNISQQFGDSSSVYLTGVRQTYWNTATRSDSLQTGFSNRIGAVNYTLSYSYTDQKNQGRPSYRDHQFNLSLSVPLNRLLSPSGDDGSLFATFNGSSNNHGMLSQQAGLSGSALEGRNLNWNVSQGYDHDQNVAGNFSGNAGLNYLGQYGDARLGYSYARDSRQFTVGVSGGVLAHRGGITLGQHLNDTSVLLSADGVSGVGFRNAPGIKTDWLGYAIKPYATAFQLNQIGVDTRTLGDDTEVESAAAQVIPTKGAIARADFVVHQGQRLLLTLRHNGKPLPFGTVVSAGESSGIVGDEGQVFLAGLVDRGRVTASWGAGADAQCSATYRLNDKQLQQPIARLSSECLTLGS